MALNPKMHVTLTIEELEDIKESAMARADEMEWQLRVELAKLREVERNLSRLLGEPSAVTVAVAVEPVAPLPVAARGTPSFGTPSPAATSVPQVPARKPALTIPMGLPAVTAAPIAPKAPTPPAPVAAPAPAPAAAPAPVAAKPPTSETVVRRAPQPPPLPPNVRRLQRA